MPAPTTLAPLIRDWQSGGNWWVEYQPPENDSLPPMRFEGAIPHHVVSAIVRYRRNNHLDPRLEHVWETCNLVWGRRMQHRWLGDKAALETIDIRGQRIAGSGRRVLDAKDYGPWVWKFLNTFGIHFKKELFLAAVEQAKGLTRPLGDNLGSGCPSCFDHFMDSLNRFPPQNVETREEARVWAWTVHDRANTAARRPHFTYSDIARVYGWPQIETAEFERIQSKLKGKES